MTAKRNMTQLNVGNVDRAIRIMFGIVLIALTVRGTIGYWGYVGVALLLTGGLAFCPLYDCSGFGPRCADAVLLEGSMQILIESGKRLAVVTAGFALTGALVVGVFAWLLNRPD
jgi:hypothetical protein